MTVFARLVLLLALLAFFVGVPVLAYSVVGHWLAPVVAALVCVGTWSLVFSGSES